MCMCVSPWEILEYLVRSVLVQKFALLLKPLFAGAITGWRGLKLSSKYIYMKRLLEFATI